MREAAVERFISKFEKELSDDVFWVLTVNMNQGGEYYLTTLGLDFQGALNARYHLRDPQVRILLKTTVIGAIMDSGIHTMIENRGKYSLDMRIPAAAFEKIASSFASRYAKVLEEVLDENYQPV